MGLSSFFKDLFGSAKKTADQIATNAEIAVEEAKKAATPYIDKAEELAETTFEKVKETASPIIEKAEIVVEETIEKAKDTFNRYSPYIKFYREQKLHIDHIIWQKVKVGDTLEKIKGSSTLKIKSRDTIILIDYKDIYKYWDSIYKNE